MRGLEALEKLWQGATNPYSHLLDDEPSNIVLKETIKKELKALEILNEYLTFRLERNVGYDGKPKHYLDVKDKRDIWFKIRIVIPQEEYDLLREVLFND